MSYHNDLSNNKINDISDVSLNLITKIIKNENDFIKDNLIEIVVNQTNYDKEEALKKLILYNFNYEKVILEYLKGDKNQIDNTNITTTNEKINIQKEIYKELGNFMSKCSKNI